MFPTIILGLALLLLYKTIGMPVFPGLLLAHCVIGMPYCFRTVLASVQALDPALEEAGQSLGAGPFSTLFLVTLPLIWQGVLSGWLFAFIVSFGELNTALFLSGPGLTTLPIEIFSYLQFQGSQLVIAAASTLQIALIVLMVAVIERVVGMGRITGRAEGRVGATTGLASAQAPAIMVGSRQRVRTEHEAIAAEQETRRRWRVCQLGGTTSRWRPAGGWQR